MMRKAAVLLLLLGSASAGSDDWPDWRGADRVGVSAETGLPEAWSPQGQNLAWRAPYGSRSTPVVQGGRLYLQNAAGEGVTLQERVICLEADSGRLIWEHRFNVFLSESPAHRVGWASPAADPATGNVYAFGVGGTLLALSRDGKVLWDRSLGEDFGLMTTHGGRTVSPVIEGDLVIVSGVSSIWGDQARIGHRFFGFDKENGDLVWMSTPNGRPLDLTTYSPPVAAVVNGTRLLIAGATDGAVHAMKPATGEEVWRFPMSKRGINTGIALYGGNVVVSHSEENLDTTDMGLIALVDAAGKGVLDKAAVKWAAPGFQGGFSSPVVDGGRIYQVDNGSNLMAFDAGTGKQLWTQNLGTIQKASLVLADGKLYVGTENGTFFILRPSAAGAQILDRDWLGSEATPEPILASAAVSDGRVYVASMQGLYAIGPTKARTTPAPRMPAVAATPGAAAHLQVSPTEIVAHPGQAVALRARLFDAAGVRIGDAPAQWSLEGLKGTIDGGRFVPAADAGGQAGVVKAAANGLIGAARIRVVPPLPWKVDFEADAAGSVPPQWVNASGKFSVREVDGKKFMVKHADNPFTKRARTFMGGTDMAGYTVQADVLAREQRRQMGDAGVIAQRYAFILFGNHQRVELQPWQPETTRTVQAPFPWKADTWYRIKLSVVNAPDKSVTARGKVWAVGEPEPAAWTIERTDPIPNRQGSPALYADAPFEILFDNLEVTPNP